MTTNPRVADLLAALGLAELAREFGHANMSTVASWKYRGAIPVQYWPTIVAFAAVKGVPLTNDDLVHAHVASDEAVSSPAGETAASGGER